MSESESESTSPATAEDEHQLMYLQTGDTEAELDAEYPGRPRNHGLTLPFHTLYQSIFNPLNEQRKKPAARAGARARPGLSKLTPVQLRHSIVSEYIARWRKQVGPDIYPLFRLILPDRDRDRPLYGLKEKAIGRILIKVLRITKDSEDGNKLLNWKLPGRYASSDAGDFASRCFEAISKRPIRTDPGDMTIGEVNIKLDQLAATAKEQDQVRLIEQFYFRMNADEMMWVIRIILRQMKIGVSEKSIFHLWHPDAEPLFNISSNLRKVCWDLYDPSRRLDDADASVSLMQCFQPQLAAFQHHSFAKIIDRMKMTEKDQTFWIEEKLDGERMQLHMTQDTNVPGGYRFGFWSRRAKDYTYLYGSGYEDQKSSLTKYLKGAFIPAVKNIILDGEMITWDMEQKAVVAFGTLKSAALAEQSNPFSNNQRPVFRVFDCLYMNGKSITNYMLRERRKALAKALNPIEFRIEIHPYVIASTPAEIETELRKVVEEASEGLVVKNPRSPYRLNDRHDDWIKVKPEYMSSFGEELDCVIVGGYYGSGHRGGMLASFLCGLRVDQNQIDLGADPHKVYSFFKVGGGFSASDYADIRNRTEGKWKKWVSKAPPSDIIELAGGVTKQLERPDMWIHPRDSVVISAKAASVTPSDSFRAGLTLRFPRFKCVRFDKTWREALSVQEFCDLKASAEQEKAEQEFRIDADRKVRRAAASGANKRRAIEIVGAVGTSTSTSTSRSRSGRPGWVDGDEEPRWKEKEQHQLATLFKDLVVYVMSDGLSPVRRSKAEIERFVTAHGGAVVQTQTAGPDGDDGSVVCIADREAVKVGSLKRRGDRSIVRPVWLYDCVLQAEADLAKRARAALISSSSAAAEEMEGLRLAAPLFLLPPEPRHMYFIAPGDEHTVSATVDQFGDSYARDADVAELGGIMDRMSVAEGVEGRPREAAELVGQMIDILLDPEHEDAEGPGERTRSEYEDDAIDQVFMFRGYRLLLDLAANCGQKGEGRSASVSSHSHSDLDLERAGQMARFLGAVVETELAGGNGTGVTHVLVGSDRSRVGELRRKLARFQPVPKIVSLGWVEESWKEKTLLDEDRFVAT